jgi:hypothetical protein
MTRKVYKSAMGKTVDLGALLLQNEQVRAVGNMGVNAAGDLIDSTNRVIDQRNRQVQRQYRRQTNVNSTPVATSNLSARKTDSELDPVPTPEVEIENKSTETVTPVMSAEPVVAPGGLAAAIARSREIKQELEKTRRQQMQDQGLKKI